MSPIASKIYVFTTVIFALVVLRMWGITPFTLLLTLIALFFLQ